MLHTIRKGIVDEMRKHWGGDMVGLAGVSFHDPGQLFIAASFIQIKPMDGF